MLQRCSFDGFRSRRRSGSSVAEIHLQQENNNGSREVKEGVGPVEGPDEMWASAALGHHRELPVDVPDTLLQQAYPNATKVKVKTESPSARKIANSRSASDLSDLNAANTADLNPFNSVQLTLSQNHKTPNINNNTNTHKIEENTSIVMSTNDSTVSEPDLADQTDTGSVPQFLEHRQKESSVDTEEDYPFAKEDYPTMLKTCSDDSASPRSSSGRSDSTAPLDGSLEVNLDASLVVDSTSVYDARRIDLGSPCRIMSDIKVAPLFNRGRVSTSFDNPAYGLVGLHDIQGLLIRSDEVSDLTRLIDDALVVGKCKEPASVNGAKLRRSGKLNGKNFQTKIDLDEEKLSRAGSTDDLIEGESTPGNVHSRRNKKKKQSSSGYSTLRSEGSTDFDASSFVVENDSKIYREMAVDCPTDFIPVEKCHPVYPPPAKTTGTLKSNNLEKVFEKLNAECNKITNDLNPNVKSDGIKDVQVVEIAQEKITDELNDDDNKNVESINNNRSAILQSDNACDSVIVEMIVDHKDSKVRSRVKRLLLDSFSLKHRKTHSNLIGTASNNSSNCFVPSFAADDFCALSKHPMPSNVQKTSSNQNLNTFGNDTSLRYSFQSTFGSSDNLLQADSLLNSNETKFSYANPCLEISHENIAPLSDQISPNVTFSTFRGEDLAIKKIVSDSCHEESFTQEKNQNSRNSFREMITQQGVPLIVYYSPKEDTAVISTSGSDGGRKKELDESPNTQNLKNAKLYMEYKKHPKSSPNHLQVTSTFKRNDKLSRENLKVIESLSKSDLNLSSPLDSSFSKVHSWLSDSNLTPCGVARDESHKPQTELSRNSFSSSSLYYDRVNPTQNSSDTSRNSVYDSVHPYEDLDDVCSQVK